MLGYNYALFRKETRLTVLDFNFTIALQILCIYISKYPIYNISHIYSARKHYSGPESKYPENNVPQN